jgi:hypothetical protein
MTQDQLRELAETMLFEIPFETENWLSAVKDPDSQSAVLVFVDSGPIKGTNGVGAQDHVRFTEHDLKASGSAKRCVQKFRDNVQQAIDDVDRLVREKEHDLIQATD